MANPLPFGSKFGFFEFGLVLSHDPRENRWLLTHIELAPNPVSASKYAGIDFFCIGNRYGTGVWSHQALYAHGDPGERGLDGASRSAGTALPCPIETARWIRALPDDTYPVKLLPDSSENDPV